MENNALGVEVVGKDETRTLIGEIGRGGGGSHIFRYARLISFESQFTFKRN